MLIKSDKFKSVTLFSTVLKGAYSISSNSIFFESDQVFLK